MSKQKMLAARELIQEKRYDEARAILRTVDHPTAREWLARIDAIAPEYLPDIDDELPPISAAPRGYDPSLRQPLFWTRLRLTCGVVMVILVLAWLGFGLLVGLSIRDAVQRLGDSITIGVQPTVNIDTSAVTNIVGEDIGQVVAEAAFRISEFVNNLDIIEGFEQVQASQGVNVDTEQVTDTVANAALVATFVSIICPALPLLLSFVYMVGRNWGALRRGAKVNKQLKIAARELG